MSCNLADHIAAIAASTPERAALIAAKKRRGGIAYQSLSFGQLARAIDALAHGLERHGVGNGMRTVVMAPPSLDFFALVFALFRVGAVIVMIDPGIGRRRLLRCLEEVEPEVFVGVPRAHLARILFPRPFRRVRVKIGLGRFPGTIPLATLDRGDEPSRRWTTENDGIAAILFTSGSTGIPKGVVYTHRMFATQVEMIRNAYGIEPGEIDLPTFPLFALFDPALGMTAVLPDMDFRRPAAADPAMLVRIAETQRCSNMFASPALLDSLGDYVSEHDLKLPTLRRVLSAGAPVRPDILARFCPALEGGAQVHTPFGATESLPVSTIASGEILEETAAKTAAGAGVCVGRPVAGACVRIIGIDDAPIATWSEALVLPAGEIGEITVTGEMVTREYAARPDQTALAKIRDGERVVHRMGDVGYFDADGRLWMCGRKSQRVTTVKGTLFTVPCEEIFNAHSAVKRCALVGVGEAGKQRPVIVVEQALRTTSGKLTSALAGLAEEHALDIDTFLLHRRPLPVDARHNAKIEREQLARWAAEQLR